MMAQDMENFINEQKLRLLAEKQILSNGSSPTPNHIVNNINSNRSVSNKVQKKENYPTEGNNMKVILNKNKKETSGNEKVRDKQKHKLQQVEQKSGLWNQLGSYEEKRKRLNEERKKEYNQGGGGKNQIKMVQNLHQTPQNDGLQIKSKNLSLDEEYAQQFKELNPRKGWTTPTYDEVLNKKRLEEQNYRKNANPALYSEMQLESPRYKEASVSDDLLNRSLNNNSKFDANSFNYNTRNIVSPRQVTFRDDAIKSTIVAEYDDLLAKIAEMKLNSEDIYRLNSYLNRYSGSSMKPSLSHGNITSANPLPIENLHSDLISPNALRINNKSEINGTLYLGQQKSQSETLKRNLEYKRDLENQMKEHNRQKLKDYQEKISSPANDNFGSSKIFPSNQSPLQPNLLNHNRSLHTVPDSISSSEGPSDIRFANFTSPNVLPLSQQNSHPNALNLDLNYLSNIDSRNEALNPYLKNLMDLSNHTSYIPSGMSVNFNDGNLLPLEKQLNGYPNLSNFSSHQLMSGNSIPSNLANQYPYGGLPNPSNLYNQTNYIPSLDQQILHTNRSGNPNMMKSDILSSPRTNGPSHMNYATNSKNQPQEYFPFAAYEKRNESKLIKKKTYAEELQIQMEESKKKKLKDKEEKERYDAKLEQEIRNYDPFGRGGGGAPMKDEQGNNLANLRELQAGIKNPAPTSPLPVRSEFIHQPESSEIISESNESKKHGRGVSDIFNNDRSEAKKYSENKYQDELKNQIEEKKREAALQKKKEQEEEARLQARILEEQRKMQEEVEAERKKTIAREKAVKDANEEKKILAEAKKKEFDEKRMELENQQKKIDNQKKVTSPRHTQHQQNTGRKSPPIPSLRTRNNDRDSPCVPALQQINQNSLPSSRAPSRAPSAQSTKRDLSTNTLSEIAKLRAFLQSERDTLNQSEKKAQVGPLEYENDSTDNKENGNNEMQNERILSPSDFEIEPVSQLLSENRKDSANTSTPRPPSSSSLQSAALESDSKFFDPPTNDILKNKKSDADTPLKTRPSIARRRSNTPKDMFGSVLSLNPDELDRKNVAMKNRINQMTYDRHQISNSNDILDEFMREKMPLIRALSRQSTKDELFQ